MQYNTAKWKGGTPMKKIALCHMNFSKGLGLNI